MLTPILSKRFGLIIFNSEDLEFLRTANVHPIPKSYPSDPSNYHPIALTSILSKVFETLLITTFFHGYSHFFLEQSVCGTCLRRDAARCGHF